MNEDVRLYVDRATIRVIATMQDFIKANSFVTSFADPGAPTVGMTRRVSRYANRGPNDMKQQ
jgi:hypothetical protein